MSEVPGKLDPAIWAMIRDRFERHVPHNEALGVKLIDIGADWARGRLPYDPRLVGDIESGVLHGGPITALMDALGGMAVVIKLRKPVPIATLDFRIDYLKPARPHEDVIAKLTCYRTTQSVGFVRGIAYQGSEDDLVASAAGAFMLHTKSATPPLVGPTEASA